MFYMLCAINIVQSILVDTVVLRCQYTGISSREEHNINRIQSAYKALVSNFGWATGLFDPMFGVHDIEGADDLKVTFEEARQLVQFEKWKSRNIRSTKDFLMKLGKGLFKDGTYNGFVVLAQAHSQSHPAETVPFPLEAENETVSSKSQFPNKLKGIASKALSTGESSSAIFPFSQRSGTPSDMIGPMETQASRPCSSSALRQHAETDVESELSEGEPEYITNYSLSGLLLLNNELTTKSVLSHQEPNDAKGKNVAHTRYIPESPTAPESTIPEGDQRFFEYNISEHCREHGSISYDL